MAHAEHRDYIVVLKSADYKADFMDHMSQQSQHPHIPDRPVDCANERNMNDRQVHFRISAMEAVMLRNDPRVESVELHLEHNPFVNVVPNGRQNSVFDANDTAELGQNNWGLYRHIYQQLPFENPSYQNLPKYRAQADYTWALDGNGVDIIVIDTGVAEGHPEFAVNPDGTGGSRVVDYDWTLLGVAGVEPLTDGSGTKNFLGDSGGHGTHVASIIAGNSFGWARKARIFSLRAVPSTSSDIETGAPLYSYIDIHLAYDLVKQFHITKPIDPITGYRRPTIVNNSWTISATYNDPEETIATTHYRGYTYITSSRNTSLGQVNDYFVDTSPSIDASIADAMAAGVIVVSCAGDYNMKIDIPGGRDYNNYWTDNDICLTHYYHRGGTPCASSGGGNRVITVGALDGSANYTNELAPKEYRAPYSNSGPGVTIWAAGTNVMGAHAPTNGLGDPRVPECGCLHEYYLGKLSGTSIAAAQVSGVVAMLAGMRPSLTQAQATAWLQANATKNTMFDNTWLDNTSWLDEKFLNGAAQQILYMPYHDDIALKLKGKFKLSGPIKLYTQPSSTRVDTGNLPSRPSATNVNVNVLMDSKDNVIHSITTGGATGVNIKTYPSHGTVTADGLNFIYTPNPGYYGPDSFTYQAVNAGGSSNAATVNINVVKPTVDNPPTFTKYTLDSGYFYEAGTFRLNMSWQTQNTAYVTIDGDPTHYAANASGGITVTRNTSGQYWQKLTAHGFDGKETTVQLPYYVNGSVQPVTKPTVNNISTLVDYGSSGNTIRPTVTGTGVTGLQIATPPSHGTATAGANLTYTPNPDWQGMDSFTYTATNAAGTSNPGTVNVQTKPPPLTVSDTSADIPFNTSAKVPVQVSNDYGVALLHAVTVPQHGRITQILGKLGFIYQPNQGYFGPDSFTYNASDQRGTSATGTATLNVAAPDPPSFSLARLNSVTPFAGNPNYLYASVSFVAANAKSVTLTTDGLTNRSNWQPLDSTTSTVTNSTVGLYIAKPSQPGSYPITLTANGWDGSTPTATVYYTVT